MQRARRSRPCCPCHALQRHQRCRLSLGTNPWWKRARRAPTARTSTSTPSCRHGCGSSTAPASRAGERRARRRSSSRLGWTGAPADSQDLASRGTARPSASPGRQTSTRPWATAHQRARPHPSAAIARPPQACPRASPRPTCDAHRVAARHPLLSVPASVRLSLWVQRRRRAASCAASCPCARPGARRRRTTASGLATTRQGRPVGTRQTSWNICCSTRSVHPSAGALSTHRTSASTSARIRSRAPAGDSHQAAQPRTSTPCCKPCCPARR
mmetsp:Transcript_111333/g.359410  ORF Transcript_111333/g.359410 Transcript_111333/m.359410 type:complete len:271 (+) Transcript_111333:560-1372(+)